MATLYLTWDGKGKNQIDFGVANTDYINGDWYEIPTSYGNFPDYTDPIPYFTLHNITYNNSTIFTQASPYPTKLVPFSTAPYTIQFGTKDQKNAFIDEVKKQLDVDIYCGWKFFCDIRDDDDCEKFAAKMTPINITIDNFTF